MRLAFAAAFVLSTVAHAQSVPCVNLPPAPSQPQPPPQDVPAGQGVFITSPPFGSLVPRNVQIVLSGAASVAAGFTTIDVTDNDGLPIETTVEGSILVPSDGLFPANTTLNVDIAPTPTNPCPGCFGTQRTTFTTTDVIDTDAPVVDGVTIDGFVLPPIADQQQCGQFNGDTHSFTLAIASGSADALAYTVGARSARKDATLLLRDTVIFGAQTVSLSLGRDVSFNLGDAVVFVVVAKDFAGNTSAPLVQRVRMRSFADFDKPDRPSFTCALDGAPAISVPSRLPRNPALRVVFPFEEVPLGLRPAAGGDVVPLVPIADVAEDARAGHVYQTAATVDAGAYDVVALACPRCICPSCAVAPDVEVTLDDVVDEAAAASPVVKDIIDDPSPPLSSPDSCQPDNAATIVVLDAADDDVSGAADLVYDAIVTREGDLPRPAGSAVPAVSNDDGTISVRLPTASIGRLAGSNFSLTLIGRDVGGHVSRVDFDNVVDAEDSGCASHRSAVFAPIGLLLLLVRRRRAR